MESANTASLFGLSPYAASLKKKLEIFVNDLCHPAELEYEKHVDQFSGAERWTIAAIPPCMERLKQEAKKQGLWNVFLPHALPLSLLQHPQLQNLSYAIQPRQLLSNREYGILCEIMGRSFVCPEACNCSAPDTGNMEVLLKHGTLSQQIQYLIPLLKGDIRSAFLMTEPDVASSDATNIETSLLKINSPPNNTKYYLNGTKWWSTGAMDPRCKVTIVLAKMDYSHPSCQHSSTSTTHLPNSSNSKKHHSAHTMVIVPIDSPGLKMERPLTVFGYDDAPHGHAQVALQNIELDSSCLILGEGKGFTIAQSRLGPGRIHHCMRAVGLGKFFIIIGMICCMFGRNYSLTMTLPQYHFISME